MALRLTWVARDDGQGFRCYSGSALPLAEIERRHVLPFEPVWVATIGGEQVATHWNHERWAMRDVEWILRQRASRHRRPPARG